VCSAKKLGELNPYVKLDVTTDDVLGSDLSYLADFQSVVLVGAPLETQLRVNEFCHSKNIPFITADTYGLFAWTFADFGSSFNVHDKNGEFAKEIFIGGITKDKEAEVTTLDDQYHDLGL
jgi:ubiquitin-activating enzyme E1